MHQEQQLKLLQQCSLLVLDLIFSFLPEQLALFERVRQHAFQQLTFFLRELMFFYQPCVPPMVFRIFINPLLNFSQDYYTLFSFSCKHFQVNFTNFFFYIVNLFQNMSFLLYLKTLFVKFKT